MALIVALIILLMMDGYSAILTESDCYKYHYDYLSAREKKTHRIVSMSK